MSVHLGFLAPVPQLISAVHSGVTPTPTVTTIEDEWLPRIRLPRTPVQLDARIQIHIRQRIVTTVETTIHTTQRIFTEVMNIVTVWEKYVYDTVYETTAVAKTFIRPTLSRVNKRMDDLEEEIRRLKFIVADGLRELLVKNK